MFWRDGVRASARPASAGGATLALGAAIGPADALRSRRRPKAFIAVAVSLAGGGHKLVDHAAPAPGRRPRRTDADAPAAVDPAVDHADAAAADAAAEARHAAEDHADSAEDDDWAGIG